MCKKFIGIAIAAAICALPSIGQDRVPVYRVTVIERTVDSVNYQYHAGPTPIDFRGTVLLPVSKGSAVVDSQQGRTSIDAKFDGLEAPQRFGPEYLSYVLWAITPDGRPHNLGEIIPNGSNKGHLPVTTDLQAFGMIVTAEPYSSVRQPSDVVVMQNEVRPDTVGSIQPVTAKVELMPRGHYTWNVPASESAGVANAPKVSMSRYQAILQTYEAQNALGIASTAGAATYAPDVFAKAQAELAEAQQLGMGKGNDDLVVQHARAATEIAEDARIIAERHQQDDALMAARQQSADAQEAQMRAEERAQRERMRADNAQALADNAKAQADNAKAQADAERAARERAEADARIAREQAEQATVITVQEAPPPPQQGRPQIRPEAAAKEVRRQILMNMNMAIVTRDTPRGLDTTLNDPDFEHGQLRAGAANGVSRIAAVLAAHPDLRISVEGYSDTAEGTEMARLRAQSVAAALSAAGVPAGRISCQSYGNSRPLVSNATEQGRIENRRVEIVVTGDSIGTVPSWDRTYPLSFNRP